ncbi:hypothetical protein [Ehrlichia ruminantium]|uniref:hypothetical protein n=1 Tax=Ehrlichia ruminantium TaxID=779 RepID=UPI0007A06B81|nr:hypothetical protein [Ehrlichia ruminantium]KYW92252.1 hypothetical protein AUR40_02925 [Ehrlichia ruminantium]
MLFTGGQRAMDRVGLNERQQAFFDYMRLLVARHNSKHLSPICHPMRYLHDKFNALLFNKQNDHHKACLLLTQNIHDYIIKCSISYNDLIKVSNAFNNLNNETCFLNMIHSKLLSSIVDQNQGNLVIGGEFNIYGYQFNPRILNNYLIYVSKYVNMSNAKVLQDEAMIILNAVFPLTPQNVLLRGIARAVIIITGNECNSSLGDDPGKQLKIEYSAAVSLITVSLTTSYRSSILSELQEDFAEENSSSTTGTITSIIYNTASALSNNIQLLGSFILQNRAPSSNVSASTTHQGLPTTPTQQRRHSI